MTHATETQDALHRKYVALYVSDLQAAESFYRWFVDPFSFRWSIHAPDLPFKSSGETAGRWLG